MALRLSKEDERGYSYEYHKICQINVSSKVVTVNSYKDQSARNSGKESCMVKYYNFPEELLNNLSLSALYNELKSKPEFSGSQDC